MITWADVVEMDATLSVVSVGRQESILEEVLLYADADQLGERFDLACKYLAAHAGTLDKIAAAGGGGTSGPLASETVGPITRSYGAVTYLTGANVDLGSTVWGRRFLALIRIVPATSLGFVV